MCVRVQQNIHSRDNNSIIFRSN